MSLNLIKAVWQSARSCVGKTVVAPKISNAVAIGAIATASAVGINVVAVIYFMNSIEASHGSPLQSSDALIIDAQSKGTSLLTSSLDDAKPLMHSFRLTNVSKQQLVCSIKSRSCGCLSMKCGGDPLKIGQHFIIGKNEHVFLTLSARSHPGENYAGAQLLVHGPRDQDGQSHMRLQSTIKVADNIEAQKNKITVVFDPADERTLAEAISSQSFTFTARSTRSKNVIGATIAGVQPSFITCSVPDVISWSKSEDTGFWEADVRVKFEPSLQHLKAGFIHRIPYDNPKSELLLMMQGDDEKFQRRSIPISFLDKTRLIATEKVQLGRIRKTHTVKTHIVVSSQNGETFEIDEVSLECEQKDVGMHFTCEKTKHNGYAVIGLEITPALEGKRSGLIRIIPKSPYSDVEIPFSCVVE